MAESNDPDRRQHRRIPISVRVHVRYTGQQFSAESLNLSAGGLLLGTDRHLPLGTRVSLRIDVPILTKYPIRAEGEVVRVESEGVASLAVRFLDLSDDDRFLLGELAERSEALLGEG